MRKKAWGRISDDLTSAGEMNSDPIQPEDWDDEEKTLSTFYTFGEAKKPKRGDEPVLAHLDFEQDIDPSEHHRQRGIQPLAGVFDVTSSTIDPDAGDWTPPNFEIEPEDGLNAAFPSATLERSPSRAGEEVEKNYSSFDERSLVISESRLSFLLEENRQNLLRSLRGEKYQSPHIISPAAPMPLAIERLQGEKTLAHITGSELLRDMLCRFESKFIGEGVPHFASKQILKELEVGNYAGFVDLIVENFRGFHPESRQNAQHASSEGIKGSDAVFGKNEREHGRLKRALRSVVRIAAGFPYRNGTVHESPAVAASKSKGAHQRQTNFFKSLVRVTADTPLLGRLVVCLLFLLYIAFYFA
jgi:hypothetical protein